MIRAAAARYRSILTVGDGIGVGVGVGEPGGCCAAIVGTRMSMKTNSRRRPTCTILRKLRQDSGLTSLAGSVAGGTRLRRQSRQCLITRRALHHERLLT